MGKYIVYVDDNYHHMDDSSRYKLGEFDTCEKAVIACKKIVDEYFEKLESEHTFEDLWQGYMMYGEDPFIITADDTCSFSAWGYAKERCKEVACDEDRID